MSVSAEYVCSITLTSATNSSNALSNLSSTNKLSALLPTRLVSEDLEVALADLSFPVNYSNVSAAYNNQTGLSYLWIDGSSWPVVLPESYYNSNTIGSYVQLTMLSNGHVLTPVNPSSGLQTLYFINLQTDVAWGNRTIVTVQVVPSSMPSGYQLGTGAAPAWTLPAQPTTPQLVLAAAAKDIYGNPVVNSLEALLGLPQASYPPTVLNTPYATLGTALPAQPVSQVSVLLDQAMNEFQPGDNRLLYSFPVTQSYEGVQREVPSVLRPTRLGQNNLYNLTLTFVDQNGLPVPMGGPLSCTLSFFKRRRPQVLP